MKKLTLTAASLIFASGCASTANTLNSSKVFAPSCPTADRLPVSKDDTLMSTDFWDAFSATTSPSVGDALLTRCSQKESIYSNSVWIPVFGPLFDLSTNTNPNKKGGWYFLSTILPVIGPAAQLGYGAKQCIAECLPEIDQAKDPSSDPKLLKKYYQTALNVSDANCRTFVSRFSVSMNGAKGAEDTLNSVSTITATGAAFANPLAGAIISGTKTILSDGVNSYNANYLQGQVLPDLIVTVKKNRSTARAMLDAKTPDSYWRCYT